MKSREFLRKRRRRKTMRGGSDKNGAIRCFLVHSMAHFSLYYFAVFEVIFFFKKNVAFDMLTSLKTTRKRLGQVLQARLRIECRALNADLYRKNIVNSPLCQCGGFENAQHLFYTCLLYAESRRNLSIRLDNYSINQLLYGIEDSTLQENTTLFIEVQKNF